LLVKFGDYVLELPWRKSSEDRLDLNEARRILDEDHYGLEDVKGRMLEFLAVIKLRPDTKSPILCFVGPPSVGKTSLGRSIESSLECGLALLSLECGGLAPLWPVLARRQFALAVNYPEL
jgi:ATP-dependent Lon protease